MMSDDAIKKVFFESQQRIQDLGQQLQTCKSNIFQRDRKARAADLTIAELQSLKQKQQEELITYKAVGKMFVKKDFDVLESDIKASAVNDRREMAVLEKTKGYLEANIKTEENNLKDLLQKR